MKIFMIGGTGLLGLESAKLLINEGHEVTTLSLGLDCNEKINKEGLHCIKGDYNEMSDKELLSIMNGFDSFVFAGGVDERVNVHKNPYEFFVKHNNEPTKRLLNLAKQVGIKNVVVLGSYFTHFNEVMKEIDLYGNHPYIRSRVEQKQMALDMNTNDFNVSVLEIPYVFGTQKNRKPVWVFLIKNILSMEGATYYPSGGTAMITAKQVGQAIVGAIGKKEAYPIASTNMTWVELLTIIHEALGTPDKPIVTLPQEVYVNKMVAIGKQHEEAGLELGINTSKLGDIMLNEFFIDENIAKSLGVTNDSIEKAIKESVELSLKYIDKE